MIFDKQATFALATSVAAAGGTTTLIGNVIDLGSVSSDIGNGEPIYLVIQTDTEIITAGTAGTIQFKLASDAQAAITTGFTEHLASAVFVTDDAAVNSDALNVGGSIMVAALPNGTYERYLGIMAIVVTTEVTAGKINAFLTHDVSKWVALPDAI